MLRIIATTAILALTLNAAHAADTASSINVNFGDLNLSRPADAKILTERLEIAAAQVCHGAGAGLSPVSEMYVTQGCVKDAINVAMLRIERSLTRNIRANLISDRQASLN